MERRTAEASGAGWELGTVLLTRPKHVRLKVDLGGGDAFKQLGDVLYTRGTLQQLQARLWGSRGDMREMQNGAHTPRRGQGGCGGARW